jgi:PTS system mannose-specific IIA component
MIGILVLTHGELGVQFINSARLIGLKSEASLEALCVDPNDSPDALRGRLAEAIKRVKTEGGVLVLTDLFGGTPTNLSLSFLQDGEVEVVTGLNLPMLIKAVNARTKHNLAELARLAAEAGKENIYLASDILRQRLAKRKGGENSSHEQGSR